MLPYEPNSILDGFSELLEVFLFGAHFVEAVGT